MYFRELGHGQTPDGQTDRQTELINTSQLYWKLLKNVEIIPLIHEKKIHQRYLLYI